MCPDIEAFAPLIQATFGVPVNGKDLRVRLADRSLRQTNPVLGVVATLLELAAARVTASEVLDLADREPVRRRFGFSDDDLARLQEWIAASGTRWGLDAEHRAPWNVDGTDTGTWRFGVDRVLAGVTMTEDERRLMHGILPLDDVDSMSINLAGGFAELSTGWKRRSRRSPIPMPAAEWATALADAADAFTRATGRDAWQRSELDASSPTSPITRRDGGAAGLAEVRRCWPTASRAARPARTSARAHLTACTLVPMRSVPHRVVCLLGLDDGVFPRKAPRDGDDLMLAEPRVGERDPRAEDRQLLLDALMAAQDKLIVTYAGRDERTNAVRPPAVPIGELLTCRGRHVTQHPLQPFDPRNFDAKAPVELRRVVAGRRPGPAPPRHPPPVPGAAARARRHRGDRARGARALRRASRAPLPAQPPRRRAARLHPGGRGRPRHRVRRAQGLEGRRPPAGAAAGRRRRRRGARGELRGGRLPPGALGEPWSTRPAARRPPGRGGGQGPARVLDVAVDAGGRPRVRGTVPGVCGTTLRTVTYPRSQPSRGSSPGSGCWR